MGTRKHLLAGALLGAAAGLIVAVYSQAIPRLAQTPDTVFPGAPQGLDQWTYFSMCRAIWRSPNGITYEYPYTLFWTTPPVMFQFPLLILAWLGRVLGLPFAFEAGRIAGAAGAGAALATMGARLVRGRQWRRWFWIAAVLGGGWFTWGAAVAALQVAGPDGLTEFWEYLPAVQRELYWWAPFIAQNLRYPLECVYHALVFGTLACLLVRRYQTALILGFVTWFSNPFTATALGAAVLPWWAWKVWDSSPGAKRRQAALHLAGWVAVTFVGWSYYGPFLGQWPVLRDLTSHYQTALTPPLTPAQLLMLGGPWSLGLIWSIVTPSGRRHVWGRPAWRLFGLLALSQLVLVQQGWLLGDRALQPFHFNRGYLQLGLVAVAWRAATAVASSRRPRLENRTDRLKRVPRWMIAVVLLTLGDQAFFAFRQVVHQRIDGMVDRHFAQLVSLLPDKPAPQLILVAEHNLKSSYVTAFSPHIAYSAPETMIIPFAVQRDDLLTEALQGQRTGVAELGIYYAIGSREGTVISVLRRQGWTEISSRGDLLLMRKPSGTRSTDRGDRV